jgi:hypothetical protein
MTLKMTLTLKVKVIQHEEYNLTKRNVFLNGKWCILHSKKEQWFQHHHFNITYLSKRMLGTENVM